MLEPFATLTVYLPAGDNARFGPSAFDRIVGGPFAVDVPRPDGGLERWPTTVRAATVDEDGAGVTIELELGAEPYPDPHPHPYTGPDGYNPLCDQCQP